MVQNKLAKYGCLLLFVSACCQAVDDLPPPLKQQLLLQQYAEAVPRLEALATQGNNKAAYLLGSLYAGGIGVDKNQQKAERWLKQASDSGSEQAKRLLERLHNEMPSDPSRLLRAISAGRLDVIKEFERDGGSLNAVDSQGNSTLMLAISQRHRDIVRYLLGNKEVDLDKRNQAGQTALHLAVLSGDRVLAQLLINAKADVRLKDRKGKTALEYAMAENMQLVVPGSRRKTVIVDVKTQRAALVRQAKDEKSPYFGWPLLSIAVLLKQTQVVDQLLREGAHPWQGQHDAIGIAIAEGQVEMAKRLVSKARTADVDIDNDKLRAWFESAIRHKQQDILATLSRLVADPSRWSAEDSPLRFAIDQGQVVAVDFFIGRWPRPSDSAAYVRFALKQGQFEIARRLVDGGFAVNGRDPDGRSSLWYAADAKQAELLEVLIKSGALVDQGDSHGVTPLMRAVTKGCFDCVGLLLLGGADLLQRSSTGNNALMFAASGEPRILGLLLKHLDSGKAGLSARNKQSLTPLMLAVQSRCAECVVLLMTAGANPYRKNEKGQNAFDLAAGQPAIQSALEI